MSGKHGGSRSSTRNSERRNGKAWGRNHGSSGGPKPKSPEKAERRQAVLDRQRTPAKQREAATA